MQRLACLGIAVLLLSSAARAQAPGDEALARRVEELKSEILGLLLLRELELERPAAEKILDLAWRARARTEAYEDAQGPVNVEFEKACRAFREEDFANKGFSREVEGRTAALEHRLMHMQKVFCDDVNRLEAEAVALLTPAQRTVIARFPARFEVGAIARLLSGKPVLRELPKPLRIEFERIRAIPDAEWASRKAALVRSWAGRFERGGSRAPRGVYDREDHEERLGSLFEDVRRMTGEEFSASGDSILERLKPPDRIREVHEEIAGIHKEHYGALGKIGRFLCSPAAPGLLEKSLGLAPGAGKPEGLVVRETGGKAPEG